MTSEVLKQRATQVSVTKDTGYAWLQELICEGFLDVPASSSDVVRRIAEKFGRRWETARVQVYMRKFVGIVHAESRAAHALTTGCWLASVARTP